MRLIALTMLAVFCTTAPAATFTVNTLADSGAGSLRDAITQAEASAGADDIVVAANLNGTISLQTALPDITQDLTITGPSNNDLIVERDTAANAFRIFTITAGTVAISHLWLGNGSVASTAPAAADGGCILSAGDLSLTDCLIFDCAVTGGSGAAVSGGQGRGGAISSSGALTLDGVAIVDCTATGGDTNDPIQFGGSALGGGIFATGPLTLLNTLIDGCTCQGGENLALSGTFATAFGGGVQSQGTTVIRDSDIVACGTFSDGVIDGGGGLHASTGTLDMRRCSVRGCTGSGVRVEVIATLENCTVSGNQGLNTGGVRLLFAAAKTLSYCTIHLNDGAGCGGVESSGNVSVLGCIIAGNTGGNPDVQGTFTDGGFNLIGDETGSASFTTSALVGDSLNPINPGLNTIQDLGVTWGHIPQFGSFAIDQGGGASPIEDQRGANRLFGAPPDIGAIEFIANQAPSFTAGPTVTVENDGDEVTIAGWATNISPGVSWEAGQTLTFTVTGNFYSFREPPEIDPDTGDLTFRPWKGDTGVFTFNVILHDNGGTAGGGQNTSATSILVIELESDDDDDRDHHNEDFDCSTGSGRSHAWLCLLGLAGLLAWRTRRA